jgi:hypothetical protein
MNFLSYYYCICDCKIVLISPFRAKDNILILQAYLHLNAGCYLLPLVSANPWVEMGKWLRWVLLCGKVFILTMYNFSNHRLI